LRIDWLSTTGGAVVSGREITGLSSRAKRPGGQARAKLELAAAAASLGLCFVSGMPTPAAASHYRHHRIYGLGDVGSEYHEWHHSHRRRGGGDAGEAGKPELPKQPSGPLILAISIGSQRVTVYDNGAPVAVSPISTGMPGHPTPMGVFSVIQKQRWHHSNLYSNAPMPYMQRITWSGVALHAGVVPGHPASHGCIRLPDRFAVRLWGMTKVGARVIITRGDASPYEITHPRLAGLVKASEAATDAGASSVRSSAGPNGVMVAATDAVAATDGAVTEQLHQEARQRASEAGASTSPQAAGGGSPDRPAETGQPAQPSTAEPVPAPKIDDAQQQIDSALQRPGPISLFVSRRLGKLFVRKGFAPVFETPITIAHPETPLGTHIFTASRPASEGGGVRWLAVSIGYDRAAGASAHAKRKGRAARDEQPTSTAVTLRQAAADALDRIEIPPEALERVAPLVTPGASLLISDQGLGSETGRDTDFIVVTK
jgi:L,D-transpeptidase-like protein